MTDLTQLEALRSRNERLLSELQDWRDAHGVLHRTHREATEKLELLAADCATLKAERDDWKAIARRAHGALVDAGDVAVDMTHMDAAIRKLVEERDRLRAALEDHPDPREPGVDYFDWLIRHRHWFDVTRAEALRHEP